MGLHLAEDDSVPFKLEAQQVLPGPVQLPGTGRMVWWTGKVAIGLRHQCSRHYEDIGTQAEWIQELLCPRMLA